MVKKSNKKASMTATNWLLAIIVVVLIVAIFGKGMFFSAGQTSPEQEALTEALSQDLSCPDDGDTSLTLNIYNPKNTSGTENYDAEITFYGVDGSIVRGTDSTDGAYTLNCGVKYDLVVESADGASGDNTNIVTYYGNDESVLLNEDGSLTFTALGSTQAMAVGVSQHATVEVKVYDNEDARFAYDSGDASNSEFEGDATIFRDGDNATAFALTNDGDFLDLKFTVRSVQTDTEFGDLGFYIAVEAPVTEYDEPTVSFDGKSLSDIKGSGLNAYETKQLSNYEYVYKVDASIVRQAKDLGFYIEANADASTDVEIDLVAIGKADSTQNPNNIVVSSANDNSGATTIYSVMDFTVDVS